MTPPGTTPAALHGAAAAASFAGLTPFQVGLYQVNVQIPPNVSLGDAVEVYLQHNQISSNKVTLVIR